MNFKLLVNYLSDECSKKEKEFVEHWIQADPKNKEFLESLRKIWDVEPDDKIAVNAERAWLKFKNEVIDDRKNILRHSKSPTSYSKKIDTRYVYIHIAAAAAIILVVSLFLSKVHLGSEMPDKEQFTMREIITEKGEKSRIKLTDGTRVILNSESRIQIPSQFVGDSREVYLTGEAHFEVTKEDGKPFIVHSNHSYTRVLGTKFVVSAYASDGKVVVAVTEGKVQIGVKETLKGGYASEGNIAEEGEVGVLYRDKKPLITKSKNILEYVSWTEGKLIFDNTPFKEIKPRIERWYDITITVDDSTLYKRELTAKFDNEPLNEVLKVMALSMDMKFNKEKGKVTFFNKSH